MIFIKFYRGACLIINNEKFFENAKLSEREGSKYDENALIKVWKMFGCDVTTTSNLVIFFYLPALPGNFFILLSQQVSLT